jgi:hypothetical protein
MPEENVGENSITQIRLFFESDERPLKQGEFVEFWKSLSEEEKDEFRHADLRTG